jgi:hypothetical protein
MSDSRLLLNLQADGFHYEEGVSLEDCLEIATSLGTPGGDFRSPEVVRFISPRPVEAAKANTLSSRHGLGGFPFHTDAAYWRRPPDLLMLCCVNPGSGRRPTLLIDPREWAMLRERRRVLCSEVWKVTGRPPFLCTIGSADGEDIRLRFDEACMVPVTIGAHSTRLEIGRLLRSSTPKAIRWRVGGLLIVDNHRLLHARGTADEDDQDRVLARILIRR